MPFDLPLCHCEYHWSQRQPLPVALVGVLNLPVRCRLSLSFGEGRRHQVLSLSLALNSTGLGHMMMTELAHRGCESEPAVTEDLLQLLMNTTVRLLTAHCLPQMSVGGAALAVCGRGIDARDIPWERWGFEVTPSRQRFLAKVHNLSVLASPPKTRFFPTSLELDALQWAAL